MINWIRSLIKIVKINTIDNSNGLLRAQVINQGEVDDTIIYNAYGFISSPPIQNAIGLQFLINGDSSAKYAFAMNPSLNPKIERGEACIFSDQGIKIYLKKDGNLDIISLKDINVTCNNLVANITNNATTNASVIEANAGTSADITAPEIKLNGNVTITGNLIVTGSASIAGKDFLTHSHSGVTAGSANTGIVV